MCPNYKEGVCEIAGIEPDSIHCVCEDCCTKDKWEWCRVYVSQFFICTEAFS